MVEPSARHDGTFAPASGPGSRGLTPVIVFGLALLSLSLVGLSGLAPPRITTGLPDDPELERVRRAVVFPPQGLGDMRFESSFAVPGVVPRTPPTPAHLAENERVLAESRRRHPRDPRLDAAHGCFELSLSRLERAERHYRRAVERVAGYGEAHLGLGVTLAARAGTQADPDEARRLRLQAIAQFAAVREQDPVYRAALYDRALLLLRVGRLDEGRRRAQEYAALEPGAWRDYLDLEVARATAAAR